MDTKPSIFRVGEAYYAALTLADAKDCARKAGEFGQPCYPLDDVDAAVYVLTLEEEDESVKETLTFADQLQRMITEGLEFPCHFCEVP